MRALGATEARLAPPDLGFTPRPSSRRLEPNNVGELLQASRVEVSPGPPDRRMEYVKLALRTEVGLMSLAALAGAVTNGAAPEPLRRVRCYGKITCLEKSPDEGSRRVRALEGKDSL